MGRRVQALVTPALLRWAREQIRMSEDAAAKKASVTPQQLRAWEQGEAKPTLRQARLLASAYHQPLVAFFLENTPARKIHIPRDLRRLAGKFLERIPAEIQIDVMEAWDIRDVALELLHQQPTPPTTFSASASSKEDPEVVGDRLRKTLKLTNKEQFAWRTSRVAFNAIREAVEAAGILVLQTSSIALNELRAYSLYAPVLPTVVINRKDVHAARSFSLVHECVHLMLHADGICDLKTDPSQTPETQQLEIFCNAVAAACLMPAEMLRTFPLVWHHTDGLEWSDDDVATLASSFGVSREALLRRLLTLGYTDRAFYERKRGQYLAEYASRQSKPGFSTPPQDAVSLLGKPFVRLVLNSMESGNITTSDASDYLGVRLKHLPTLRAALASE